MESVQQDFCNKSGAFIINKPIGVSSKDISRKLQKVLGRKLKMGHAGTLDVMAEGLLPILIGKATKIQDYLTSMSKSYRFELTFGLSTDTCDITGEVLSQQKLSKDLSSDQIQGVCNSLLGDQLQVAPMYSAIKHKGVPLYKYARKGQNVIDLIPKRQVHIYQLKLLTHSSNKAVFEVKCSKGTYVRSLGVDIAKKLGTIGTVSAIKRLSSSGFTLECSHKIDDVVDLLSKGQGDQCFLGLEQMKFDLKTLHISQPEQIEKLQFGQILELGTIEHNLNLYSFNVGEKVLLLDSNRRKLFCIAVIMEIGLNSIKVKQNRSLM